MKKPARRQRDSWIWDFLFSWLKSNCWLNRLDLTKCRHGRVQWRRPETGLIPRAGPCAAPSPGSFGCCEPNTTPNSTKLLHPRLYATEDDFKNSGEKDHYNWPKNTQKTKNTLKGKIFAASFKAVERRQYRNVGVYLSWWLLLGALLRACVLAFALK